MRKAILATALCALACGCSPPVEKYFVRRGMDLADCFDVSTGVGELTPYVRLKATDWFVVGAGHGGTTFSIGWHGRYTAGGTLVEGGEGVPFARNEEWAGAPPMIHTHGPFRTTRTYDPKLEPAWGTRIADRYVVGVWFAWLVSLRAGLNPVELADFVTGLFGWDILADDDVEPIYWQRRIRGKPFPAPVL